MPQFNIKQVKGSTQGSVLFLGTNAIVSENNGQFYWDNANGALLIGTTSQFGTERLRVNGSQRIDGDLFVVGSFSVYGSASVINTQNLYVQDPIILLAATQTGSPVLDSGFFVNRGTGATQAFIWDESDSKFSVIQTDSPSTIIGDVGISSGAEMRALRYNFFDTGSPANPAGPYIYAPSGGSMAINSSTIFFYSSVLSSSGQPTYWDIGVNTLEFAGSGTRSIKINTADYGVDIPTFVVSNITSGSTPGLNRTGLSFSHIVGSTTDNVIERAIAVDVRDSGTYGGTSVGIFIDMTGVTSSKSKYGLRIVDGNQASGYVLTSDSNGYASWTSSIPGSATGSGTMNYIPRWLSSTNLSSTSSIYDDGITIGVGTQSSGTYMMSVQGDVNISGTLYATSKSFEITHPLDSSKRLTYGSLEGPEYGVYYRGKLERNNIIDLPNYWTGLIDESSITVNITPIGFHQRIFVEKIENNKVYLGVDNSGLPNCYYIVYAERKDIPKIIVE